MENKIFIISFMKSGITSATEFLKELKLTQAWPINFTAIDLIKYGEFDIHLFNSFYKRG